MPFKVGEIATGLTNSFKLPLTVGKKTATVNGSSASIASEVPGSVTLVDTPVYGSDVVINVEDFNLDFTSGVLDPRITFTRSTTGTYVNNAGVLTSAAINEPRFDYDPVTLEPKGLLIEEQRTNTIRNNTMQGAVVGTPGTLPTNWVVSNAGTLTREVVGTGISNGITYVDIRFSGTTSTTSLFIYFDSATAIIAAQNQTWTQSIWVALSGGSLTNIASIGRYLQNRDSGGAGITSVENNFTPTATLTRAPTTATWASASTAYVQGGLSIRFASGVPIDITLRIGLPQLELGAFATSVIPTAGAAATRTADLASVTGTNFSSWYNQTEGTFMFDYNALGPRGTSGFVAAVVDSADWLNNYLGFSYIGTSTNAGSTYWRNGGAGAISAPTSLAYGGYRKYAPTYDNTRNLVVAVDGAIASSLTSTTSPPAVNRLNIGRREDNSFTASLWLRRLVYYPTRLSNAELQSLTADRPIVTYTPV